MDLGKKDGFTHSSHLEEKTTHFSQLSSLRDHSLNQLRDHIKQVMIPMLIKTFQCQLEMPLEEKEEKKVAVQETCEELRHLDRDLHTLDQWVQSCRLQIQKALSSANSEEVGRGSEGAKPLQDRLSSQEFSSGTCKATSWWRALFSNK